MTGLPAADRFGEGRDDNPYWNESVWFAISKPEIGLHGFVQYYFRPNMGLLNGGPVLWDGSGQFQWNCRYYNWSHLQAMPKGARKFDMTAANSLRVRVIEPLTRYAIAYDADDLRLDLEWRALGPMHELRTGDPGQRQTAKFHIEQPGRMTGTIVLGGEVIAIDGFSMRDTSYGAREYASLASGGYFWGIAADSSFHGIAMGEGREQKLIGGYLMKDGVMASLASGRREVLEFGPYGPRRVRFEATDEQGRSLCATGTIADGLIFTGYTDHTVVWSLIAWDWDGIVHWGDNQEFCPMVKFRRIARGELPPGGAA